MERDCGVNRFNSICGTDFLTPAKHQTLWYYTKVKHKRCLTPRPYPNFNIRITTSASKRKFQESSLSKREFRLHFRVTFNVKYFVLQSPIDHMKNAYY